MASAELWMQRFQTMLTESSLLDSVTKVFRNLPSSTQELMLNQLPLESGEEALAACTLSETQWSLLTTKRLIWKCNNDTNALYWNEIADADPCDTDLLIHSPELKKERRELFVKTVSGGIHKILLEPVSFHAFWRMILALINAFRNARSVS